MTLRTPIKALLQSPVDASSVARIRAGVLTRERTRAPRWRAPMAVAAVAAAALTWLFVRAPSTSAPLTVDGVALAPIELEAPRTIALDDGSTIRVGAGARLVPRTNDGREVVLDLERGTVELDVRPRGARRWIVEAGWATVEVVGTRFVVAREPAGVEVSVSRGEVVVRGERVMGRERHLIAGQRLRVEAPEPPRAHEPTAAAREPARERDVVPPASEPPASESLVTARPRRAAPVVAPPENDALPIVSAEPAVEAQPTDPVAALLAHADAARAAGRAADAVALLQRLVDEHAADPRAGMAAFTLARLELDVLHDPGAALAHLERAEALGLPRSTREDARARRVEALARSGQGARARDAAAQFASEYPASPRLPQVLDWAGRAPR